MSSKIHGAGLFNGNLYGRSYAEALGRKKDEAEDVVLAAIAADVKSQ